MPQTVRKFWGPIQGRKKLNFDWSMITHGSVVLITASEYDSTGPLTDKSRFLGDAVITVENISPHGGPSDANHNPGVAFYITVEWNGPVNVATDITVLDNQPVQLFPADT